MVGIDYGADPDLLARIVWQHVEQGAVLYEPPALECGMVGEAQGVLQRLLACRAVGARSRHRYVGFGWSAGGRFVKATFHFEHTACPGAFGALPYDGGGSLLMVETVEAELAEGPGLGLRTLGALGVRGSRVPT
jgi:hypothetical protein